MLLSERKNEIRSKAKFINDSSEQYQLIHATYATQELVQDIAKEIYGKQLEELSQKIRAKMERDMDIDEELKEKERLQTLIKRDKISIAIGYIDISDENIARAIKVNNNFTIYLAASLKKSIFTEEGEFNYHTITKIRKLMSHELGHLVLHTKDLLVEDGTQGSLTINSETKEAEADFFGETLLEYRKERNRKISKDGGADKLF